MSLYQELIKNDPSLTYLNDLSEEQASFLNQILSHYPHPIIFSLVLELKNQNALDILGSLSQINIELLVNLITVFQSKKCHSLKFAYTMLLNGLFQDCISKLSDYHSPIVCHKIETVILQMLEWRVLRPEVQKQLCAPSITEEKIDAILNLFHMLAQYKDQIEEKQFSKILSHSANKLEQLSQWVTLLSTRGISLPLYINFLMPITENDAPFLETILLNWPQDFIANPHFLKTIFKPKNNHKWIRKHLDLYAFLIVFFTPAECLTLINYHIPFFDELMTASIYLNKLDSFSFTTVENIVLSKYPAVFLKVLYFSQLLGIQICQSKLLDLNIELLSYNLECLDELMHLNQTHSVEVTHLIKKQRLGLKTLAQVYCANLLHSDFLTATSSAEKHLLTNLIELLFLENTLTLENIKRCLDSPEPMKVALLISNPDINFHLNQEFIELCCQNNDPVIGATLLITVVKNKVLSKDMLQAFVNLTSAKLLFTIISLMDPSFFLDKEVIAEIGKNSEFDAGLYCIITLKPELNSLLFKKIVGLYSKKELAEIVLYLLDNHLSTNDIAQALLYPQISNLIKLLKGYCLHTHSEINCLTFINTLHHHCFSDLVMADYIKAFAGKHFEMEHLHYQLMLHQEVLKNNHAYPFVTSTQHQALLPSQEYEIQSFFLIPILIDSIDEMTQKIVQQHQIQRTGLLDFIFKENIIIDIKNQLSLWGILSFMIHDFNQKFPSLPYQQVISSISESLFMVLIYAQSSDFAFSAKEQFMRLLLRGDLSFFLNDIELKMNTQVNSNQQPLLDGDSIMQEAMLDIDNAFTP